jgi:alpha-L-fucosidase
MKRILVTVLLLNGLCVVAGAAFGGEPTPPPANAAKLEDWRAMRFGMFIHWGPVSLKGTEIGWSRGSQIPIEEYDRLYTRFNPVQFNAEAWAQTAREAGMKYMVFTTKHHDGFCMWDTKQTDFNVMKSPFGRDVVKELSEACREKGLAFGTYHSVCDWHHPDFPLTSPGGSVRRPAPNLDRYEQYLRAEVKELITGYGPLLIMWFDVPQEFSHERGLGLERWTRSLQPDIIINNRSGARGDYDTPEQQIGSYQDRRPWETCMTICQQWAWKPNDAMKSLQECLRALVFCAGGDGNLLFNVGPTPEGLIEARQVERLKEMGAWLEKNGESIYGTRGGPFKPNKNLASTRRGNTVYVHAFRWEGDAIELPDLPRKVASAAILGGRPVATAQEGGQLVLKVPAAVRQPIDTIIKLELDGSVMDLPAVAVARKGGVKATASNTFQHMEEYGPDAAFDQDPSTRWATDGGTHQAWIVADLGRPRAVRGVRIAEAVPYDNRVQKFEFQYKQDGQWKTLFTGTTLGSQFHKSFDPVTAQEFRLNILDATEGPTLSEIELLTK